MTDDHYSSRPFPLTIDEFEALLRAYPEETNFTAGVPTTCPVAVVMCDKLGADSVYVRAGVVSIYPPQEDEGGSSRSWITPVWVSFYITTVDDFGYTISKEEALTALAITRQELAHLQLVDGAS